MPRPVQIRDVDDEVYSARQRHAGNSRVSRRGPRSRNGSPARGWDALYVALVEALRARLLTMDERLRRMVGPQCEIEVIGRC